MSGTAAHASMSTRHQTSLQLSVDAARTITSRTANSYSVSGSGVTLDVGGGDLQIIQQVVLKPSLVEL